MEAEERNRERNRVFGLCEVESTMEEDFRKMFRMTRNVFEELLSLVDPFIYETNEERATRTEKKTLLHTNG